MSDTYFEMVKYHGKVYPLDIPINCEEVACNFDTYNLDNSFKSYSLHTEYSYGKRDFKNQVAKNTENLYKAHKDNVPRLWMDEEWAKAFAEFVIINTESAGAPSVIEIHPPFNDYTENIEDFLYRYKFFEERILDVYKSTIMIENRCGSIYKGGKFSVSKTKDLLKLSECIDEMGLKLRIALDIPQLFTAHNCKSIDKNIELLEEIKSIRHNIDGVHLWGKKKSETGRKIAHCGNLHTYFNNEEDLNKFMLKFVELFDDKKPRKLVLEVNSGNEDLLSIIDDLKRYGINFV